ncbi:thioesterase domain-containing protein [Chromobacterium sphagni]|uniref:thioesterase domain-containing protein n=1 Tax=Chromobacterium sphagni TaxID=1903179 RepID=UPI0009F18B9B
MFHPSEPGRCLELRLDRAICRHAGGAGRRGWTKGAAGSEEGQEAERAGSAAIQRQPGTGLLVPWLDGDGSGLYRLVAKPGQESAVYGVQSRGIRDNQQPISDMGEMAQYYADLLLAARPDAGVPFQLGGYSEGGLIAYEVARRLQLADHQVGSIVMLDTPYLYGGEPIRTTPTPGSCATRWSTPIC